MPTNPTRFGYFINNEVFCEFAIDVATRSSRKFAGTVNVHSLIKAIAGTCPFGKTSLAMLTKLHSLMSKEAEFTEIEMMFSFLVLFSIEEEIDKRTAMSTRFKT